ncbi:MAG: T9SS type A sorting domain-containing protein [Chitinophagales bacterium]|nr:T9SS type A sorting domain-containing protein [Chitinophagales bacterium]
MKKNLFLILLFHAVITLKGQFVTIPDANFRNYLKGQMPLCFNGSDQLDTTCLDVQTFGAIALSGISHGSIFSLEGMQYFRNVQIVNLQMSTLTYIPAFSSKTREIWLYNCDALEAIPSLPETLTSLRIVNTSVNALPQLPNALTEVICTNNDIALIPNIPNGNIIKFDVSHNELTSLGDFPEQIIDVNISNNKITALGKLPKRIDYLDCSHNLLTSLYLPEYVSNDVDCSYNLIEEINAKNDTANIGTRITAAHNKLSDMDRLPYFLMPFGAADFSYNEIEHLDFEKILGGNVIPNFSNNNISSTSAISLNKSGGAVLNNNPLSCLPGYIDYNPMTVSPKYFEVTNTLITCKPYQEYSVSKNGNLLTNICDETSGCPYQESVKGRVFLDINNDFKYNPAIDSILPVFLYSEPLGWMAPINLEGNYNIGVDSIELNTIAIYPYSWPYTTKTPVSYIIDPAVLGFDTVSYDFALQLKPNIKDLSCQIYANARIRPGFLVDIIYRISNPGTLPQSNVSVKLKVPNGLTYLSGDLSNPNFTSDTIIWDNIDLSIFQTKQGSLQFTADEGLVLGEELTFECWIEGMTPDSTPYNNYSIYTDVVRGSFDPNEKLVNRPKILKDYKRVENELIYVIHFQNVGTDTAFNVVVKDKLDKDKLELSTLEILSSSHNYKLNVQKEDMLEFVFAGINLPDSTTNDEQSKGYVAFSILPKENLTPGTEITNSADIYFDFNLPVMTNLAKTLILSSTSVHNVSNSSIKIYPNPTHSKSKVVIDDAESTAWILYDLNGKILMNGKIINQPTFEIDMSNLPTNVYFLTIISKNKKITTKIIRF